MNTAKKRRSGVFKLTVTAMLIALIAVMTFTPLGYFSYGPLELTLLMIPVIVGAVSQGPLVGAVLGAAFGITSFIQCFMGSALGAVLVSESIVRTFIVCFVSRVIAGFLCGLIFKLCARADKKQSWSLLVASVSGSLLNTALFLGLLALCFFNFTFTPEQAASLGGLDSAINTVIAVAASVNAPVELAVCAVVGSAVGKGVLAASRGFDSGRSR